MTDAQRQREASEYMEQVRAEHERWVGPWTVRRWLREMWRALRGKA